MIILIVCVIVLVVSYSVNIFVEENNKEVTKEFIEELEEQNKILIEQNRLLKKLFK